VIVLGLQGGQGTIFGDGWLLRGLKHRRGMIMEIILLEIIMLALLAIGVFAAVWELERIRQILDKRP
jgi:hypothetical protein